VRVVAKPRIMEITLSVIGPGQDEYQDPDMPHGDGATGDRLVISVRIKGAKRYARPWARVRPT
jgi:hypothetical protein